VDVQFQLDGQQVAVPDDGASLLEALRDRLGVRSAKDGCSPQGQCGCCTVWVDGSPRVACVTPVRRVSGRAVTTVAGLEPADRDRWAAAFCDSGASQCGFCTPGIIMRLAALGPEPDNTTVERALLAHLCRCTGWRTILEAVGGFSGPSGRTQKPPVDDSARRATLEGGSPQRVDPAVALGEGGFADDTAPSDALVAVRDASGGWAVGETLTEARTRAGKIQGRRTTVALRHPIDVPPGDWDLTLRTTWVEPAYLEPDASWCLPGGEPVKALANGGAFGGKLTSIVAAAARQLADAHARPVRVLFSREDAVRLGPKRPPIAAGLRSDGTGLVRAARTPGIAAAVGAVLPDARVEEMDVAGPPTSIDIRAAGWAEAAILRAALGFRTEGGDFVRPSAHAPVVIPSAGTEPATASAWLDDDGAVHVEVCAGEPLDDVVLRSYCIGAAHMAVGWVRSEGIAVDADGEPQDLTIRSFGILRAQDTPPIHVTIRPASGPAARVSDAVFAAVAAATWLHEPRTDNNRPPQDWPTRRTQS